MEAKKLMIGDWVYNSYHKKNIRWDYSEMFCSNGIPVIGRDLEPIPLTKEILKANGFHLRDYNDCYLQISTHSVHRIGIDVSFYDCATKLDIEVNYHGYFTNRIVMKITYVHELQHALRLCGLNDLADNFKIE